VAGVAAVIGIYVVTALEHTAPAVSVNVLICALAVIAFGVVVAMLAEIAVKDRQPSVRSSVSGMPVPR
jgi:hypothetical protein